MIDSYKQLPLGKYIDILEVLKDKDAEEIDKQVKVLSILCDVAEEELLHLPIPRFRYLANKLAFLEGNCEGKTLIAKNYIVGSYDLVVTNDYRKIETCQYVDFISFVKDIDTKIVEVVSTMLVPRGHRYNEGYDILDVQKALRESMCVQDAVALCAFFLTMCEQSMKDSVNFCLREVEKVKNKEAKAELKKRLRKPLMKNGDGSQM